MGGTAPRNHPPAAPSNEHAPVRRAASVARPLTAGAPMFLCGKRLFFFPAGGSEQRAFFFFFQSRPPLSPTLSPVAVCRQEHRTTDTRRHHTQSHTRTLHAMADVEKLKADGAGPKAAAGAASGGTDKSRESWFQRMVDAAKVPEGGLVSKGGRGGVERGGRHGVGPPR